MLASRLQNPTDVDQKQILQAKKLTNYFTSKPI